MVKALNTTQNQRKICKIYAKFNAKYVRSTPYKNCGSKETKVLWHNGRRGDKQTGGQQFESHTQLEVNSSSGRFDFS